MSTFTPGLCPRCFARLPEPALTPAATPPALQASQRAQPTARPGTAA